MPKATRQRRTRGEGSIYQIEDGRWKAATYVDDPVTGKRVRKVVSGRTADEAREALAKVRERLAAGGAATERATSDYLTAWIDRVRPRLRAST